MPILLRQLERALEQITKQRNPRVGPRGGRTEIQSLLFAREKWTRVTAREWARSHGFKHGEVLVTAGYFRFRQSDPGDFRAFRTKVLSEKKGIKAIIGVR